MTTVARALEECSCMDWAAEAATRGLGSGGGDTD